MSNQQHDPNYYPKSKGSGVAIFLIVIGVLFLLSNLNIIPYGLRSTIFSWKMLLVGIGIWSVIKGRTTSGIILIVVGSYFLLPNLHSLIPGFPLLHVNMRLFWPLALIAVGIYLYAQNMESNKKRRMLFEELNRKQEGNTTSNEDNSNQPNFGENRNYNTNNFNNQTNFINNNVIFSSSTQIVLSKDFKGGDINVAFGSFILDLRKAELQNNNAYLEIDVFLGNYTIYLPENWEVHVAGQAILGSILDKRFNVNYTKEEPRPVLTISGSCLLGSGEIKN